MAGYKLKLFFFGCFLAFGLTVQAQDRYAIHYKYKPQTLHSLENPETYLSSTAIERRFRYGIPLDSLDLPVSEKYIEILLPKVQEFLYHSHWMNASVVIASSEAVQEIGEFDFVEAVIFAGAGYVPDGRLSSPLNAKAGLKANMRRKEIKEERIFDFQNSLLGIPEMQELGYTGKGITIAVFDAGFPAVDRIPAFSHLFTNNQIIGTKDFVHVWNDNVFTKNQHGTNVLSLMAANDPESLLAAAPDARYILCITEEVPTEFRVEEYNWIKAAEYADSLGVDIINSSLGYWDFDDPDMDYTSEDMDGETALISVGAAIAAEKGILVVTSAGNYGGRGANSITAPADAKGVLSVGATDMGSERVSFSSQGPSADGRIKPEVSTFGQQVWLLRSNGNLSTASGTSFSSPQIAALAAGLWQAKPEWGKDRLIEEILKSSTQALEPDNLLGYGIPNFLRAYYGPILQIQTPKEEEEWKVYPNPIGGSTLFLKFGSNESGEFSLLDLRGNVIQKTSLNRRNRQTPFEIMIPDVPAGVYLVEMQSGSEIKRIKLMKR
jgi:serine protease AprX